MGARCGENAPLADCRNSEIHIQEAPPDITTETPRHARLTTTPVYLDYNATWVPASRLSADSLPASAESAAAGGQIPHAQCS
jgi:hypothetical protein